MRYAQRNAVNRLAPFVWGMRQFLNYVVLPPEGSERRLPFLGIRP